MMTEEDTHNNKVDNETEPEIGGSEQVRKMVFIEASMFAERINLSAKLKKPLTLTT